MRALSVKQPHAERIASGAKRVEYRTWCVAHRGDLLIVSSKAPDIEACDEHGMRPSALAHGVTICVVELVRIDGNEGDYEWRLARPRRVAPIAVRGYAALYNVDDELIQLAPARAAPR